MRVAAAGGGAPAERLRAAGIGSASGYGTGGGDFGAKGTGGEILELGTPRVAGALERAQVEGVVKRPANQLRHWYQHRLLVAPCLLGKIVVKAVVAPDGTVSSASIQSTTMAEGQVESCLTVASCASSFPCRTTVSWSP